MLDPQHTQSYLGNRNSYPLCTCTAHSPCMPSRFLPMSVGSAGSALPPFGGRFPPACPQTVLASLPAYGFPLVTSVYLP